MEILLGLFGFLVLIDLITVPMFGAGLFRIVFCEILGAIFDPLFSNIHKPDVPKVLVADPDQEWTNDTFVGYACLPYIPISPYFKTSSGVSFDRFQDITQMFLLPEQEDDMVMRGYSKTKEERRNKLNETITRMKNEDDPWGAHLCKHPPSFVPFHLEVYKKRDGTYYAWPEQSSLRMRAYRTDFEFSNKPVHFYSVEDKRHNDWYDYHTMQSVDALMFYYNMPYIIFDDGLHPDGGYRLLSDNTKFPINSCFQICRGDRPLILERCENTNHKIQPTLYKEWKMRKDRGDPPYNTKDLLANGIEVKEPYPIGVTSDFGYRVVSKGHLRVFLLDKNGNKVKEVLSDDPMARSQDEWRCPKLKFWGFDS